MNLVKEFPADQNTDHGDYDRAEYLVSEEGGRADVGFPENKNFHTHISLKFYDGSLPNADKGDEISQVQENHYQQFF